jgi:4-alpha-glucanotransferase
VTPPLFAPGYRASGVLLHVTSLPSRYGIGDAASALGWIDRLHEARQGWWEALPLGPTGYHDSPYQSLSSFAGNWLLVSPDWLVEDGLLQAGDTQGPSFPSAAVDYGAVSAFKRRLLETVWTNFTARDARPDLRPAYTQFCHQHRHWLEDYALFRALKARHGGAAYLEWPAELAGRAPNALAQARRELADRIDQVRLAQFLLFRQGARLMRHASERGVQLIGDLPFYVAPDSSDCWANPDLFLLDQRGRPRVVAGAPPDYFSADGQLWGNPVYNWDALRLTGYRWWIERLRASLAHVDIVRLDHFRGFAAAWHVPAGAPTARSGRWVPGPGNELFSAVQSELGTLPVIAEDLGLITPEVSALRNRFGVPGTRVLQFAFDGQADNPHLPGNYDANTVVYTGTHDNPTTREWYEDLPEDQRRRFWSSLKRPGGNRDEAAPALMDLAWSSIAGLAIAPLQDVLNLGREARMNVPGRADGNWRWRCTEEMLTGSALDGLRALTVASGRSLERQSAPPVSMAATRSAQATGQREAAR